MTVWQFIILLRVRINLFKGSCLTIFITSTLPLAQPPRPWSVWRSQFKVVEVWERQRKPGWSAVAEGGHRMCGGSVTGVAWGCGRGEEQRWTSLGSQQRQPTQQMLASCCMEAARLWVALCVGHTQREGQAGECVSLSCHPPQRRPD